MAVDFIVDDEKEFKALELEIYGWETSIRSTYTVYIRSTGKTHYYISVFFNETQSWIPVLID